MRWLVSSVEEVVIAVVKTNPPQLFVRAKGIVPTSGWTAPELSPYFYIMPPADGIWDFSFTAEAPSGIVLQVLTQIYADTLVPLPQWLKGVRIHASSNQVVKMLGEAKSFDAEGAKPFSSFATGPTVWKAEPPFPW
jgi:hypothetical protein